MRFYRSVWEKLRAAVNFPSYCSHHKVRHDLRQAGTLASRSREAQSADCVVMSFPSTVPPAWREEKSQSGKRKRWRWKEGRKVQEEEKLAKGKLRRKWLKEWEERTQAGGDMGDEWNKIMWMREMMWGWIETRWMTKSVERERDEGVWRWRRGDCVREDEVRKKRKKVPNNTECTH